MSPTGQGDTWVVVTVTNTSLCLLAWGSFKKASVPEAMQWLEVNFLCYAVLCRAWGSGCTGKQSWVLE